MRLSEICYGRRDVILEAGYGRVFDFDYDKFRVDRRPKVLVLGRWRHPGTGNTLVCGINLNYLSSDELIALRKALGSILSKRRLKDRYWEGMRLLPKIFKNYYRTYNQNEIDNISKETLRKWPGEKAREKEERAKRWREMTPDEKREAYRQRAAKAAKTRAARREPIPEPRYE